MQIRDLFAECRDGVPLLATMDAVRPGCVPWKKVRLAPKNRHHVVENGNRVVAVGRGLDLVLVNIGGVDIADGNKKLILAVVWQLMRQQTIDMLKQLKGDGTAVDEADLVPVARLERRKKLAEAKAKAKPKAQGASGARVFATTAYAGGSEFGRLNHPLAHIGDEHTNVRDGKAAHNCTM